MASFLSQATSYFNRTNISTNYVIQDNLPPVHAGLWKIYKAYSKSAATPAGAAAGAGAAGSKGEAGEDGRMWVSVWVHNLDSRGSVRAAIVEQLKKEASTLLRLRHPCILSAVEPLEETRSLLTFATEPVLSTLTSAMAPSYGSAAGEVALDEVEIQKGLLQVARGLEFLHEKGFVHGNLDGEAVLVNAKGDWKVGGFGFLTAMAQPDGTPTPYRHPDYDPSLPPALSRNFDFLAPEYALDQRLSSANDMFALGCLVYAIHSKGVPPFRNRNSVTNLRTNVEDLASARSRREWQTLGKDVIDLLNVLVTRHPGPRVTAKDLQRDKYFNNILVKTLKFMERDSFAGRSKDERVQFLRGLLKILPQFSDRLQRRKVLPALLELMTDRQLLPYVLPLIFAISKNVSSLEFTGKVLPGIKPLFKVQDPPQNQLILLDQIELFVAKTSPPVFREEVTPLLYSSLESEQVPVQERALQSVPRLCEILEYSHVKEVLFPAIAKLFAKTKVLSVKCNTLICFHSMIPVLDKYTLTEKLVPILARIKTREPSVMIATLAVHEAMSKKVDKETLAMEIIPQLWKMSMGAQLNADQFKRFMTAVKEMGERVEKEQFAHLKEAMRMQEHTESYVTSGVPVAGAGGLGGGVMGIGAGGEIDFESLVGGANDSGVPVAPDMSVGGSAGGIDTDAWDWDAPAATTTTSSTASGFVTPNSTGTPVLSPSHTGASVGLGGASRKPLGATRATGGALKLNGGASQGASLANSILKPSSLAPPPSAGSRPAVQPSKSSSTVPSAGSTLPPPGWSSGSVLAPASRALPAASSSTPASSSSTSGPNYNISLEPARNFGGGGGGALTLSTNGGGLPPLVPQTSSLGALPPPIQAQPSTQAHASKPSTPAPGWGGAVLQPSTKATPAVKAKTPAPSNDDWGEFDPW